MKRAWVRPGLGGVSGLFITLACLDRPIGTPEPVTTNIYVEKITQTAVDKIDLLFMIDNSGSMSDKQAILRLAVPDLVERLVNPICVDPTGNQYDAAPPGEPCPPGRVREFDPVGNIHVGVISSSLGDLTADNACPTTTSRRAYRPDAIDQAHLLGTLPRGRDIGAGSQGFLEWRSGVTDPERFSQDFATMIERVGEEGCGFEASLESWYRFLVDPAPYRELRRVQCAGSTSGQESCVDPVRDAAGNVVVDRELLDQRAAFLRPDSLVAVIMLSDENDCSVQATGTNWFVLDTNPNYRMYRASSTCEQDPNAKCCYSCGVRPPEGCTPDPICEEEDRSSGIARLRMPPTLDSDNLRCFDQKRRFGIDLLYPTARYVNALREYELCLASPDLSVEGCPEEFRVRNPLYAGGRDRSLVFLGGIVGVSWQSIASEVDARGLPLDPESQLRFKTSKELTSDDVWSQIVGSRGIAWQPARAGQAERGSTSRTPPSSPYMVESELPRAAVQSGNAINGREYDTTQGPQPETPSDLEYACIFPLPEPKACTPERKANGESCDCYEGEEDRPLCEVEPGESSPGITQHWAKAYPGTRQLEVLRDYGDNSIVASICARNVNTEARSDFGYRPAIAAVVDRLKEQLESQCLPRALAPAPDGTVPCTLVETKPNPESPCRCDSRAARGELPARVASLVRGELSRQPNTPCGEDDPDCSDACLCEVLQVQDAENADPEAALASCRQDEVTTGVEGWCYVANTPEQQIGNPQLVAGCPATRRQILRFAGAGLEANTTTFLACVGSSLEAALD